MAFPIDILRQNLGIWQGKGMENLAP